MNMIIGIFVILTLFVLLWLYLYWSPNTLPNFLVATWLILLFGYGVIASIVQLLFEFNLVDSGKVHLLNLPNIESLYYIKYYLYISSITILTLGLFWSVTGRDNKVTKVILATVGLATGILAIIM